MLLSIGELIGQEMTNNKIGPKVEMITLIQQSQYNFKTFIK